MGNENCRDFVDLSDDWWRAVRTCQVLSDWFSRHLVALLISVEVEGKPHDGVFTGFLLDYGYHLFWVTAGHVVDEIKAILANPNYRVRQMAWLDSCPISGAEAVFVHNRALTMLSACEGGTDFGVAIISGLDEANIRNNDRVEIMTEQIWWNLYLAQPEGYYILGYPQEWVKTKRDSISEGQVQGSLAANLACLPLGRIEYPGCDEANEFWNDPEAFYGQILPFVDGPGYQPRNIQGVSGGPLFSIERERDGQIRYRLFGIQSAWLRSKRLIRAEPVHKIVQIIKGWDEEHQTSRTL